MLCLSELLHSFLTTPSVYHIRTNAEGRTFDDLKPIQNYFVWNSHAGPHRARDAFADLLMDEFKQV